MKLGSLFDGIGGFPLVGTWFGIEPVWASEIEPAPLSITKRNLPTMKHLGDITKVNGGEIEPVDIITFGSPCQNLSVAGNREGLAGSESGLFMEAIRIIKEMREATNGIYPRFIVWENVLGALSSQRGRDFQTVLSEITETDIPMPESGRWARAGLVRSARCDLAWRVFDAQYWGRPQHRERIFLVGDFRKNRRSEILFESESVHGHFAQSQPEGERATADTGSDADRTSIPFVERAGKPGPMITGDHNNRVTDYTALLTIDRAAFNQGENAQYDFRVGDNDTMPTLVAKGPHAVLNSSGGGVAGTLDASYYKGQGERAGKEREYVVTYMVAKGPHAVMNNIVRRITPRECERLQGFPDDWTLYGADDEVISDTQRYRALGNSVALPCVEFVLGKIKEEEECKS